MKMFEADGRASKPRAWRSITLVLFASCFWARMASANDTEKNPFDLRMAEMDAIGSKGFVILPYYTTYVLPASYQMHPSNKAFSTQYQGKEEMNVEVKYQISIRFPLWLDIASRGLNLYAAYTQTSFWQAYNDSVSSAFRDTNYEPELMLVIPLRFKLGPVTHHALALGFVHQSNGRSSGELDQSWNRLYGRLMFSRGPLLFAVRAWYNMPNGYGYNTDISNYYGYGDVIARLHLGRHTFSAMFRDNLHLSENHGAVELGWTYPFVYGLRWYIQYWNGYGESIVDYNFQTERIGAGILLGEWL